MSACDTEWDRRVLKDLSFHIPPRSFQFLTGPSGAGKTTLIRLLFLSLKPTRGLIRVFGRDTSTIAPRELPALRRRIGVVCSRISACSTI